MTMTEEDAIPDRNATTTAAPAGRVTNVAVSRKTMIAAVRRGAAMTTRITADPAVAMTMTRVQRVAAGDGMAIRRDTARRHDAVWMIAIASARAAGGVTITMIGRVPEPAMTMTTVAADVAGRVTPKVTRRPQGAVGKSEGQPPPGEGPMMTPIDGEVRATTKPMAAGLVIRGAMQRRPAEDGKSVRPDRGGVPMTMTMAVGDRGLATTKVTVGGLEIPAAMRRRHVAVGKIAIDEPASSYKVILGEASSSPNGFYASEKQ